uniref:Uncharacterized protein n=1 Tax=Arundo donax TaxID=35708 RepID=A0A0A9FDU9_ARUDO
MARRLLPLSS